MPARMPIPQGGVDCGIPHRLEIGRLIRFIYVKYKTRENSNFLKKGKMVISIKIRNFSRSRMTKRISPLESSREI